MTAPGERTSDERRSWGPFGGGALEMRMVPVAQPPLVADTISSPWPSGSTSDHSIDLGLLDLQDQLI